MFHGRHVPWRSWGLPCACAHTAELCAGFTIVDCLALGTMGHIVGVGIVLGLKATGSI